MEPVTQRTFRGRANGHLDGGGPGRRAHHGNKRWVADGATGRSGTSTPHTGSDGERWERGGHRGGGRGRGRGGRGKFSNASVNFRRNGALDGGATVSEGDHSEMEEEPEVEEVELDQNEPEAPEERENFWQELVKAREVERKRAIAEGKMDDPLKPKRLEDAITMVGTCLDMCPRFERYRRERENNLFEWETIPGTKRVDHKRAVKAYERAAGDKTLPSDLRPPDVLKHTLDYLFHDLLPRGGFSETFNFIRDRSRAVRNDFTMQHEMGPLAIECHDRCARFHILAIHVERDRPGFSVAMEEQQLMNTLQSLKEFYEDQRGRYQSPTELEIRVYHRLIHIRDQRERHDDIPPALLNHPVFELTTRFRARVQAKSAPISKTSPLLVDAEAMQIFAELAGVLRREGNVVMTYLVACILERHFGKDTIENIESIRGELTLSDIIDGYSGMVPHDLEQDTDIDISVVDETEEEPEVPVFHESPKPVQASGTQWLTDNFGTKPTDSAFFKTISTQPPVQPTAAPVQSAFATLKTTHNVFGTAPFETQSAFAAAGLAAAPVSVFGPSQVEKPFASGPAQPTVAAPSNGPASLPTFAPPSISSVSPFGQTSTPARPSIFASLSGQAAPAATPFLPLPQANGFTSGATKLSAPSTSEVVASKPLNGLNPLAPTFTPTIQPPAPSTSTSTTIFGAATTAVFGIQPPSGSSQKPTLSVFPSIPTEPSVSIPTSQTQVISESSTTTFLPSPPHSDVAPLVDMRDQTPPAQPPPLNRHKPISLPPTPTASFYTPSVPQKRKSIFDSLKNIQTQTSPVSAAPTEILSPLVLQTPVSRSLASIPSFLRRETLQSPLRRGISASDVEEVSVQIQLPTEKLTTSLVGPPPAEKEKLKPKPNLDILEATANHFTRRSWTVKQAFLKWREKLEERVRWVEACRRSTAYKEKVQVERLSRSLGAPPVGRDVERKVSSEVRRPLKKRLKERLSGEYRPPQNDEELAKRFEKNQEAHTRRWARGSFLRVLKDYLDSASKPLPDSWSAWLSLNQESDGTAIWLEQKFDVPNSGKWTTETVFQIPLSQDGAEEERSYPGVIVFERTPLTGVTDILEKKFRTLEDCTRLREIIEAFPADRHYVPALLCVAWSERDPDSSKDFDDMVESMVEGGMLVSSHEMLIATAALDMEAKLEEVLRGIPFDVEGRLVKRLSLNDAFKHWEHLWDEMTTRLLPHCSVYGEFLWDLYARLLEGCTWILRRMVDSITGLLRGDEVPSDLPRLQLVTPMDSDATFDVVLEWLQGLPGTDFTLSLINDITAHQSLGRDFPTLTFLPQLLALARSVASHLAGVSPEESHYVSRSRLDEVSNGILALKVSLEDEMKALYLAKTKPSKRLASFEETSSMRSSTPRSSKKRRVSTSDGSLTDEESSLSVDVSVSPSSPPLSVATSVPSLDHIVSTQAIVTSAMLRSLTKDIRAKYGAVGDSRVR